MFWLPEEINLRKTARGKEDDETLNRPSNTRPLYTCLLYTSEMSVCIATYKSGTTMIRLIDTDNNKIACEIYVYVKYFNSPEIINWGIPLKGNPDYRSASI